MKLDNYKKLILNNFTNISDKLNKIKTRTVVILFLLVHLIFNYKDARQGIIDGWSEATVERLKIKN